ncbi:MAG: NfeD family protein [Desulforhopalus sp.]|jgi:membrane protein implicated in regulation of membrane protease activity|nr:NfeD family protein [Desulforhopalus sp.]
MGFVHPALYWLIIGVILFFLEFALPGFIMFFFAVAALLTAVVAWLFPIPIAWQLVIFIGASVGSLLLLRKRLQQRLLPAEDEESEPDVAGAVPGDRGVVTGTIAPPAEGRIKYAGSFWRATADEPIDEGEIVTIVRQKGLVVYVEKV